MTILNNISLKTYNTFGIDVKAKHFVAVKTVEELKAVLALENYPEKFILGGGSNMLLTKNIDALVIHIAIKGITIASQNNRHVSLKVGAGENWHEFVLWCLDHDFGGVENLSLIPGNIGTAPIQNIGAYGVEIKDVFESCEAIHMKSKQLRTFRNSDCNFDYRNSIFKTALKGEYIILNVSLRLSAVHHDIKIKYGAITSELERLQVVSPTIQDVSKAVINIRESKLPNPKIIGNSGSFFKNPIISTTQFKALKENFPEIPNYIISENEVKIPAGWLIEHAGFKGKDFGDYGVHKNQALVLVNYGNAKGKDIFNLAKLIQSTIERIFKISLEAEVNII